MKKIYDSLYYMDPADYSISLETAGAVTVLPNAADVPALERGDVYIISTPLGGSLANGGKSNLSATWTGVDFNATNFPTLNNAVFANNQIQANAAGASFTTKNLTVPAGYEFSSVNVEVDYLAPLLKVGGTAGAITLSGQPLAVGTKLLVTQNGTTFETTITALGTSTTSGHSWSANPVESFNNSDNWCKVLYDGTRYVILSGNGTLSKHLGVSADGETWSYVTLPVQLRFSSMVFSGTKYVAIASGSNTGFVSNDLVTFTPITLPANKSWSSVIWTGTKFVVISSEGTLAFSTNGTTWTAGVIPIAGKWSGIAFGSGIYVAVQGNGSPSKVYATSTDGITWTQRNLPTTADASNVNFLNSKFIITFKGSKVLLSSTNGTVWLGSTLPVLSDWMDSSFGGGEYAVCSATNPASPVYTSTDLINWVGETVTNYKPGDLYDLASIAWSAAHGFVSICKSYDRVLSRATQITTTGNTYSPAITGLPTSVSIGGQTAGVSFINGASPPTIVPATITKTAPDANGLVKAKFSLVGPATQFQLQFNMNLGDAVTSVAYTLYQDSTSAPVTTLNANTLYGYVTDGVDWFLISQGGALSPFTNPTNFPIPGNPTTTYTDTTNNISYRWDPVTNSYVTVGDGRLYQFSNRAGFPATGLEFNHYIDRSTGVEYYWDPVRAAYIAKGGGDTPIGTIHTLFGSTVPAGYLLADGSAFNTTTYPFLHAWLQAEYPGYVSGILPDLTNMHLRMTDGARAIGDYQVDAILQHSHTASLSGGIECATVIGSSDGLYSGNNNFGERTPSGSLSVAIGGVTGASTASENRVKNKAVKFIIKAVNGHMDTGGIPAEKEIYFFATFANFPSPGVSGKIYIDQSNDKAYFWNGSYVSLGWSEKNAVNIVPVTSSPFNYTSGQFLDVQIPNAIINLPLLPSGQSIKISNSGAAHNTVINANVNGATSNNSLINPYNKITLTALATEFRID